MIAAGVIEPVIAHDKVSVKLSLPQRSVHGGGWLFNHRSNARAMKVSSRQTTPRSSSVLIIYLGVGATAATTARLYRLPSGIECRKNVIGMVLDSEVSDRTLFRRGNDRPRVLIRRFAPACGPK